ncbi:MAG: biopolymer transporter ExbD [Verrucomicrobiota bacterium]|nr:biopolymer transporter ExbD [Verrucomicrobiota bacterium]
MKLARTKDYPFGWLVLFPLLDVVFLLIFFVLLSSTFVLQPGIAVSAPFSKFTLAPQINYQIISVTSGSVIYFRDQRVTLAELGAKLDQTQREGRSVIIKADRATPYDAVVQIANLALEHRVPSVALATSPTK